MSVKGSEARRRLFRFGLSTAAPELFTTWPHFGHGRCRWCWPKLRRTAQSSASSPWADPDFFATISTAGQDRRRRPRLGGQRWPWRLPRSTSCGPRGAEDRPALLGTRWSAVEISSAVASIELFDCGDDLVNQDQLPCHGILNNLHAAGSDPAVLLLEERLDQATPRGDHTPASTAAVIPRLSLHTQEEK